MRLQAWPGLLREAFSEWQKDDAPILAAALAYYGLFSFVPLIILIYIFINSLLQNGLLDGQIAAVSRDLLGRHMPRAADDLINAASFRASSFSFTLLSIGLLLFGAGGLFVHTRRAFQITWGVPHNSVPFIDTLVSYLRSYLVIGLDALLLLVMSIFTAVLLPLARQIEQYLPIHIELLRLSTFLVSFSFVTMLFAATYKALIAVKLSWRELLPGSALASLLFAAGNFCIEAYVGRVNIASAYGAAGSLVIFLFWIYYSAQIFLFGAEVVKVQKRLMPLKKVK